MTLKVGINGLGRIGLCVIRAWIESGRKDIEIVAANHPAETARHVHLLKYDSVHGVFKADVKGTDDALIVNGKTIKLLKEKEPEKINWKAAGVDVVLECTGKFTKRADAAKHLIGGAKKVVISAPSSDADAMIVKAVNEDMLKPEHEVISIGSCTTNCLAPLAKVLLKATGIEAGFMTTIHSYTNDQNILDGTHKDLRRARAAALSMIPTTTGAASALGKVIPELKGKLDGVSIRVPTPNVSMIDLTYTAPRKVTAEEINQAVKAAADGPMKGILRYCDEALVSTDFTGDPHSSIFDATQTQIVNNDFVRVAAWYDNEWGFSVRMLDVTAMLGKK
ncbi:MAG: type I glyceraldehyde-3-phosphate dehydrogenase [Proteobacteria bacterium]|nr:type I glyceraldehyde-3-phosphate dehydrogenase [Pseudomonadota bacterium]